MHCRNLAHVFLVLTSLAVGQERRWVRLLDDAVFTVAINPENPRTLYAGGLGHRLYRSTDGGLHWDTLIVDYPGGAAQFLDVFIHRRDTAVLLVGGSGFGKLIRSSDGGRSWQEVLVPEHSLLLPSGASIVAHPLHPDTIVVAEYIGPGWSPPRLYRSQDGGRTWDTLDVFPEPIPNCAMAVRWDSLWLVVARCDGALFVSDDWRQWRQIAHLRLPGFPQESEIPDLLFVPEQPRLGFLAVTFLFDTTIAGRPNGGLYRTTDGGYTWELIAFPDTSLWAVASHRQGSELELAVGGFTLYPDTLGRPLVPGSGIVRISPDGGQRWIPQDDSLPWVEADPIYRRVWRLKYSPTGTLYVATEAGLYAWEHGVGIGSELPTAAEPSALVLNGTVWAVRAPCTGKLSLWKLPGRLVRQYTLTAGMQYVDLSPLAAGVYSAELQRADGRVCRRWLVLRLP